MLKNILPTTKVLENGEEVWVMKKPKSKKLIAAVVAAAAALGLGILWVVSHKDENNKSENEEFDTDANETSYYEDYVDSDEMINDSVNTEANGTEE